MMETILQISGVTKRYDGVTALNKLTLEVRRGEMYGLVGPDGAGKTTLMRLVCGILQPDEGEIFILNQELKKHYKSIKKRIGYLSQHFSLYGDLTIDENIDFFAELNNVRDYKPRKEELLKFTRLAPFRKRFAGRLSGGMKKKLALACTLIHVPEIIFLDEPTTGVDPVSRRDFWTILSTLRKSGLTIVMSTPYLDEAERCTRVGLIYNGQIILVDDPKSIKKAYNLQMVELICQPQRRAYSVLKDISKIKGINVFGGRIHVVLEDLKRDMPVIASKLKNEHITWSERRITPSFEDIFISLIERQAEKGTAVSY